MDHQWNIDNLFYILQAISIIFSIYFAAVVFFSGHKH